MKTHMKVAVAALALAFSVASHEASAQQQGGVTIGGNAKVQATGQNVTTTAEQNSTAATSVGRVMGNTNVKGNVDINANATNVTTSAKNASCAETAIGVIGSGPCSK
jgi:hypothetical protein